MAYREISDFLRKKGSRSISAAQVEARRHFSKLEKEGESVKDMLEEVMMYTYVDKDNFKQDKVRQIITNFIISPFSNNYKPSCFLQQQQKPPPLFDPGTQEPYLGAAVRTLGGLRKGDDREKAISHRLFRDKPFKAMYICLATDVDGKQLSEPASVRCS